MLTTRLLRRLHRMLSKPLWRLPHSLLIPPHTPLPNYREPSHSAVLHAFLTGLHRNAGIQKLQNVSIRKIPLEYLGASFDFISRSAPHISTQTGGRGQSHELSKRECGASSHFFKFPPVSKECLGRFLPFYTDACFAVLRRSLQIQVKEVSKEFRASRRHLRRPNGRSA